MLDFGHKNQGMEARGRIVTCGRAGSTVTYMRLISGLNLKEFMSSRDDWTPLGQPVSPCLP